ncbi:hypothetical protein [Myroides sp. LoEW2-1]|uniref:hypothetical protein n=1 Tax=Myroides sp. LoEW2-1 TaxID=2683192 RepID=UPI00132AA326|nr:hypothetical protein [Myroides sp. LoEW2-1]MVX35279.1 hypothetical protein [Myroides sp. LoEW2-1]
MNLKELLFGKKIEISPKMDEIAQKLINNEWFINCGPEHQVEIETYFKLDQVRTIDEVEQKMSYKKDVKNFVTLDNLFIESARRGSLFNLLYYPNDKNSSKYNNLTEAIDKKYIKKGLFKPDYIFHLFNEKYNVDWISKRNLDN